MALLGANLDYTSKDFDSLRDRLFNLIASVFPNWSEQQVSNFGNMLVELFAHVGDVLLFYQDNQANESRITQAQLRRTLLALAKLVGFTATGQTAATVDLQIVLTAVPGADVTFVSGDTFRTAEVTAPIVFQVLTPVTITAATDPPVATVTVENSVAAQDAAVSNNQPNQEFVLQTTPFLEGSLTAPVAGDGTYTVVDSFLDSTATDRHVTITVDENDRARVRFGNGVNGKIPEGNITFDYKTGGGDAGNVDLNTITIAGQTYSTPILTVTNPVKASGGAPRQTTESIREDVPRFTRVLTRTVAREDYEINGDQVAGVARTVMLTSNERASIQENRGQLVVVPEGGGLPSTALKADVLTQVTVTFPNTLTFLLDVIDPTYVTVDVQAEIYLFDDATPGTVDAAIRAALTEYFAIRQTDGSLNPEIDFGFNLKGELAFSNIHNVVRDITGIRKIGDGPADFLLNGLARDVPLDPNEFPELGTVTLINGVTGSPVV
jgi:hypothetical protein